MTSNSHHAFYRLHPGKRSNGAALVIVLAFVVLLTGVVVAFFSRAMSELPSSNSSASQTKAELLAQGAMDRIVADLKQEIVSSSSSTNITTGAITSTIYSPSSPTGMLPALAGSTGTNGLENVIKMSFGGSASTVDTSLNGRFITAARWNKPLLMPVSGANLTPALKNGASFTAPTWILLARGGTVTTLPNFTGPNSQYLTSGSNPVLGRYAYIMYHEGGLLDVNVAGYPSTTSTTDISYKKAAPFANLSTVFIAAGVPAATAITAVDKLVSWRNYVSAQPNSGLSGPNFTAASGVNYSSSVLSNTNGFLSVNSPGLFGNQSDRMFVSRQTLITFVQNQLTLSGSNLNVLNYLSTFTRDLNQPSVSPDPARPKTLSFPANTGSNGASGNDDLINPKLLTMRVPQTVVGGRNDGSDLVQGEPLVKSRFNLNRLAWLTYKGPISDGSTGGTTVNADPDLQLLAKQLHDTYGLSWSFLQMGTAANIYRHFGLTWIADNRATPKGDGQKKWVYDHSKPNPTAGTASPVSALGTGGIIMRLSSVATANREADFVELLKSTVAAGSKAKAATLPLGGKDSDGSPISITNPNIQCDFQNKLDTSLEFAILQIAANIIDQADLDGFPTRILFNDGSVPAKEFAGIENLPYLYRVRTGYIQGREPAITGTPAVVTDTGFNVIMQFPELWNPHDQRSPRCALDSSGKFLKDSTGKPLFPMSFRTVVDSIDPDHLDPAGTSYQTAQGSEYSPISGLNYYNDTSNTGADATSFTTPGYPTHTPFTSNAQMQTSAFKLYAENSALSFAVDENSTPLAAGYFREPTILCSPKVAGNSLKASGSANMLNPNVSYGNTTPSDHANIKDPAYMDMSTGAILSTDSSKTKYLGFYIGTVPAAYYRKDKTALLPSFLDMTRNANPLTYRVQYEFPVGSGIWMSYDTKYINSCDKANIMYGSSPRPNSQPAGQIFRGINGKTVLYSASYDPRTSRFSLPNGGGGWNNETNPPGGNGVATAPNSEWLDPTVSMSVTTARPDYSSGYFMAIQPAAAVSSNFTRGLPETGGWFNIGYLPGNSAAGFGLLTQNNPVFTGNSKLYASGTAVSLPSCFYSDPDGVTRRAMGAYFSVSGTSTIGLPMATANTFSGGVVTETSQVQSRPIVLNRPFRSVGELGHVFSGTPWKNLDFFTPESGDASLLDLFTLNDTTSTLVAGKVNLNTRQAPVLAAVLEGAYKDEQANYLTPPSWKLPNLTSTEAATIASTLVTRTTSATAGKGPLANPGDLVGRYTGVPNAYLQPYDGFSDDLSSIFGSNTQSANIQRMREAPIRALAMAGQTRVWNLLIDVIAQTGRYPSSASGPDKFVVEGEQRYWLHVAIDRFTGQVIDKQIEVVKE
jgi:Tfp pilus assembly protein PilX